MIHTYTHTYSQTVNQIVCMRNCRIMEHFIQLARVSSTNLLPCTSTIVEVVLIEMKVRVDNAIQCRQSVDEWMGTAHCSLQLIHLIFFIRQLYPERPGWAEGRKLIGREINHQVLKSTKSPACTLKLARLECCLFPFMLSGTSFASICVHSKL